MTKKWFLAALIAFVFAANANADVHHGLSPVYHFSRIESESGQTFSFNSPGFSYSLFAGRKLGFLGRLTGFFPLALRQDGESFSATDNYSSHSGAELLLGLAGDFSISRNVDFIGGLGFQTNGIKLLSSKYDSFKSLTSGLAADLQLLLQLSKWFEMGIFFTGGWHFADLIHEQNALKYGFFICTGLTFGIYSKSSPAVGKGGIR